MDTHHKLRSFRDMTEGEKIAKAKEVSDAQAREANRISKEVSITERIAEQKRKRGRPRIYPIGYRRKDPNKTWVTIQCSLEVRKKLNEIARLWNIPRSAVVRYAIQSMIETYGFKGDVLTNKDRRAMARDERSRKPYQHQTEASRIYQEEITAQRDTPFDESPGGNHSEGSPDLHGACDQEPSEN